MINKEILMNIVIEKPINKLFPKKPIKKMDIKKIDSEFQKIYNTSKKGANINIEAVTKVYPNGIKAVNSANINIHENEFICLLGPSGCGKTTILRMLAGLENISGGLVKFDGNVINALDPGKRNLAMVFQNYALYPFMSVYKNISFGLKIKSRKNHIYESLSSEIRELSSVIGTNKKLMKHELHMLENNSSDELIDIKTALKIKKQTKAFDNEFKILSEKKNKIIEKQEKFANDNLERIKILELAVKKYRRYINAIELSKLELKGATEDEIKSEVQKGILKLKELKIQNKKKIILKIKDRERYVAIWRASIPTIIDKITKMLGINNYLNRKPAELSGGQRQRVALARAISKNSSLFLYDEPLSNLDAKLRGVMRSEIRKLHDSLGATSLYVTHDQIEAMTMADRIVIMNTGYVHQIDSPKVLYENPADIYVATFIGSPEMNIMEAKLLSNKSLSMAGNKKIEFSRPIVNSKLYAEKSNVLIGIRPGDIITDKDLFTTSKGNVIEGEALFVEDIGQEKNVRIKTVVGILTATFDVYNSPSIGEKVKVMINPSRIHIFDMKTGIALTSKLSEETKYAQNIWLNSRESRIANKIILYKGKNKLALSNRLWRSIHNIISPKFKKEWTDKKNIDKKNATKDFSIVEEYYKSKK